MSKVRLAELHDNGILKGYTEPMDASEAVEDDTHVIVPEDCDLTPERYRFTAGAFYPLRSRTRAFRNGPSDVEMIHACAQALIAMRDGKEMPQYTRDRLAEYEATFDQSQFQEGD